MNQGPGGNDPNQNPAMRIVVSSATALIMSALLIGFYALIPQHEAKLRPDGPRGAKVQNGVWEHNDLFGLIDTQWTMVNGLAEGTALQYHPNGSLFREMTYRGGRLDGTVVEYYEKPRFRQTPVRGRLADRAERMRVAGSLRKRMSFVNGRLDGKYEIFYADGVLKEERWYREGKRERVVRYKKDGQPAKRSDEEALWTRSN